MTRREYKGGNSSEFSDAVEGGDVEKALSMIQSGSELHLDKQNSDGWTPVMHAFKNLPEVALALIKSKHNLHLDKQNSDGWTPAYIAFAYLDEIPIELIKSGRELYLDKQDKNGMTAVHYVFNYDTLISEALIKDGRELYLNKQDKNGWTPAMDGLFNPIVAKALLEDGRELFIHFNKFDSSMASKLCKKYNKYFPNCVSDFKRAATKIINLQKEKDIYKHQEICRNLDKNYRLQELKEISTEFNVKFDSRTSKRELCADIAKKIDSLRQDNKNNCPEFISLLGDDMDDLPPELIFKIKHHCFNVLELKKLVDTNQRNPMTREELPKESINKRINQITKLLTSQGIDGENEILKQIRNTPIFSKEEHQKQRINSILVQMNYSPELNNVFNSMKQKWKSMQKKFIEYLPFRQSSSFDGFVNEFVRIGNIDSSHLANLEITLDEFLSRSSASSNRSSASSTPSSSNRSSASSNRSSASSNRSSASSNRSSSVVSSRPGSGS